ncbi:DUF3515 domain-containing protein [Nocardia shimofusensis]|uniref:DUF3515 domain-containing protein n=1 Tax=Nocardia shimofusensis TaxID=228596 RepID=UPI0009FD7CA4|nr:DUF3515 domain-containing protein [Nocardia shimofusensis]
MAADSPDEDTSRTSREDTSRDDENRPDGEDHAADSGTIEDAAEARYSPGLIATAVALPVILVVGVLVAAVIAGNMPVDREPLALGPVPAPAADGPACAALLPALPDELGDYTAATLVEPVPPATKAWQPDGEGEPIVLRCGLDRPLEFNRAAPLQIVNDVRWFEIRDDIAAVSTWFAVDRETYIALTIPDGSGPTPLQAVSDAVTASIAPREIDPGPLPN